MSRLKSLSQAGTAVWLDFVERSFLQNGDLLELIERDGVTGVTSNPAIFEAAIKSGGAYGDDIAAFYQSAPGETAFRCYEHLAISDIKLAADQLQSVYVATKAFDGYVSLEVSPELAYDASGTVEEARSLWERVGRDNLMIKVPGTEPSQSAIRQIIADGINVNVTLLFSLDAYKRVLEAWAKGLEDRLEQNQDISRVASVASFFISRVDAAMDKKVLAAAQQDPENSEAVLSLKGQVAISNAVLAYKHFQDFLSSARWKKLADAGAQPQRLLWASTGTKDPEYSDTLYVDELIAAHTVNTMPPKTMDAFRDSGNSSANMTEKFAHAEHVMSEVERLSLGLGDVLQKLEQDGVRSFCEAFERMLSGLKDYAPA